MPSRARMSRSDFCERMWSLGAELLPADSVRKLPHYVQSAVLQMRREVLHAQKRHRADNLTGADLEPLVSDAHLLGPYERNVVAHILTGPANLLAIPGASGSGKSSTVLAIRDYLEKYADEVEISSYLVDFNLVPILENSTSNPQERKEQQATVLSYLDRLLLDAYEVKTTPKGWLEDLRALDDYVRLPVAGGGLAGRVPIVTEVVAMAGGLHALESLSPSDAASKLREALVTLPVPGDRASFMLALIEAHHRRASESGEHRTILIIDNTDPLPPHTQQGLLRFLVPLALPLTFTIIIPVRLATYENSLRTHPFDWFVHSGPLPTDVLFVRLTRFLMEPESSDVFRAVQNDELKSTMYCRVAELWMRVFTTNTEFRDVLESVVGHNVRNAFILARSWLCEETLGIVYASNLLDSGELKEWIQDLLATHLVQEATTAAGLGMQDEQRRQDWARSDNEEVEPMAELLGRRIAARAAGSWFASLNRFTQGYEIHRDPGTVIRGIPAALSEMRDRCDTLMLPCAISDAVRAGKDLASRGRRDANFCDEVHRSVLSALPDEVDIAHSRTKLAIETKDPSLQWIRSRLERGMVDGADAPQAPVWGVRGVRPVPLMAVPNDAERLLAANSSFAASRVLLEEQEDPSSGIAPYVANVFAVQKRLCPAALRILYLLGEDERGRMPVDTVIYELRRHAFEEPEILTAVNALIHTKRRVVWLDKEDHYETFGDLNRIGTADMFLSATGQGYYETLVAQPTYLQTMMERIPAIRSGLIGGGASGYDFIHRMRGALVGLQTIAEDEMDRLEAVFARPGMGPKEMTAAELRCQNAAVDILVRSMRPFVLALFGHYGRLRPQLNRKEGIAQEMENVRALAREWVKKARELMERNQKFYQRNCPAWEIEIEYMSQDVEDFFSARREHDEAIKRNTAL